MTSNTILTPSKLVHFVTSVDVSSPEKARLNMIKQFNAFLVEDKENIQPQTVIQTGSSKKERSFEVSLNPHYEIERQSLSNISKKREPFTPIPVKMLR